MSERLESGTKVSWTSQSQGVSKTKTGTIVAFVPAGKNAHRIAKDHGHTLKEANVVVSNYDRYLVDVPRGGKSTKSDLYAPKANQKFVIEEV